MKHRNKMTILALIFGPFVYIVYDIKMFFLFIVIGFLLAPLWFLIPIELWQKLVLNLYIIKFNPIHLIINIIVAFDIRKRATKEEQMQEQAKQSRSKRYQEIRKLTKRK